MSDPGRAPQVSRRTLLGGLGAATGSTAVLGNTSIAATVDESSIVGPGSVSITLVVNGVPRDVIIEPCATLVEVLRGPLDLTGTKLACDRGACSACTVWLDGAPVAACMLLAIDVGPRAITTIEGLAQGDTLHPVQAAFIAHDALQCGYCTPGMVMSCAALLRDIPHPTAQAVQAAISGHLCRCGTYPHIIEAVLAVSEMKKA